MLCYGRNGFMVYFFMFFYGMAIKYVYMCMSNKQCLSNIINTYDLVFIINYFYFKVKKLKKKNIFHTFQDF